MPFSLRSVSRGSGEPFNGPDVQEARPGQGQRWRPALTAWDAHG